MWQKLVKWAQGRTTLFAIFFAISGTVLEWFRRLEPNYILLIGAIQALVLAHSAKEDYFAMKNAALGLAAPPSAGATNVTSA